MKQRKGWGKSCDVGKETESLEMSCDVGELTEWLENEQIKVFSKSALRKKLSCFLVEIP